MKQDQSTCTSEQSKDISDNLRSCNKGLKVPRGTKDFTAAQLRLRNDVLLKITDVFIRHGAQQVETPVFELKAVLTEKYGEDSKLIYDLKDQGGELLSLRYDLTVPFARFLAMHKISSMKRYQIGKVYRRDKPYTTKGRFREFYQCDFDIAGKYDSMIPDAECIKILDEILTSLNIGKFTIKINHRKILDGIFEVAGIPFDKIRGVSSTIDKLDKNTWDEVAGELKKLREVNDTEINIISEYMKITGTLKEVLEKLKTNGRLTSSSQAQQGIEDMKQLEKYIEIMRIDDIKILFDLSLARGLDYYTGVIFEATVSTNGQYESNSIGSVAGGGRYDTLVGMLDPSKRQIPCVGVSIGVERIFNILESKCKVLLRNSEAQIYVACAQKNLAEHRLRIACILWDAGLRTELSYKDNPKLLQQFQYCEDTGIPWVIVIGQDEVTRKIVKLRNVKERKEFEIPESVMVDEVKNVLQSI